MTTTATHQYRPLHFGVTRAVLNEGQGGVRYLKAEQPLEPCAQRLTDRLLHWAQTAPDRTFMAQRVKNADGSKGDWKHIGYAEALAAAPEDGGERQHRSSGAGPPARLKARPQGSVTVSGSQVHAGRDAKRGVLRTHRGKNGPARQPHLRHAL